MTLRAMHPLLRHALRRLLVQFGPALLKGLARADTLLADVCGLGLHHSERLLLVHALRDRVPAKVQAHSQGGVIHR